MNVKLAKFGKMLISRPAGKEAFLSAKAYVFTKSVKELTLDFLGVEVMTPSWLDEFLMGIRTTYPAIVLKFTHTDNESVKESLSICEPVSRES